MKIVSSGKGIHSPEFHKKKKRKQTIRIVGISLLVIIIVAVPIYLLRTQRFLISSVVVSGNNVTPIEDIQKIVTNKINGNYLLIFPKSNDLLYPKSSIIKTLLQDIPRLSSVNVSLINPHTLSISVVEHEPFALYCTNVSDPSDPSGCFFLNKDGYIFSEAPAFSGGVYFVYTNDPVFDVPLRQSFLNKSIFDELPTFITSLHDLGLVPLIFVDKGDEYDLVLASGATVMWKASSDLGTIYSDLQSFLSDPSFTKEKAELGKLLYIDLRFGNKVFYKFNN